MKCLQGINAVVIRSNESPDPALLEGRGSLLPSMGCSFSPQQGLSHPQECEICLSPTSREILQTPRGMPVWKACSSSIQPLVRAAVATPRVALTCYQNALSFLLHRATHWSAVLPMCPGQMWAAWTSPPAEISGHGSRLRCYFAEDSTG